MRISLGEGLWGVWEGEGEDRLVNEMGVRMGYRLHEWMDGWMDGP